METALLSEIAIVLGLSVAVLFLCTRLRIPTIVGFLVTGAVAGPYGPGLVREVGHVEVLAEVGVILLLFTIGLEFSLRGLAQIKKSVLLGGSLQVLLTGAVGFVAAEQLGLSARQAVFVGCLLSLSSTAIVMRLLQQRAELETPHGRCSLGILIFQDLAIVPMMLLVPLLAGEGGVTAPAALRAKAQSLVLVGLVLVLAVWVVPRLLHQIVRTRSRELFLLTIIALCAAVAWLTSSAGLSLALGAFLAGLIISESPYSRQALGDVLPFRDVFSAFFFISIGMLLDLRFVAQDVLTVLLLAAGVLLVKSLLAGGTVLLLGLPLRTAVLVGLALSQVGEFSFVLSRAGVASGLLSAEANQLFLAVSILTMAATPLLVAVAPRLAQALTSLPLPRRLKHGWYPLPNSSAEELENHLLIVGFGINGRNVARAARAAGIRYHIIELNPDTVRTEREKGEPISYGDATSLEVLEAAGLERAHALVIAIADAAATRRIIEVVRRVRPDLYVLARTRFLEEVQPLYELGATEVIPEEYETSVEIFARVLRHFLVPPEEIEQQVAQLRADGYEMLRGLHSLGPEVCDLRSLLPNLDLDVTRLDSASPWAGRTLAENDLRRRHGLTVLAVRRGEETIVNPPPDLRLQPGDVLITLRG